MKKCLIEKMGTSQDAKSEIATDWISAYKKYVPPNDEFKVRGGWD